MPHTDCRRRSAQELLEDFRDRQARREALLEQCASSSDSGRSTALSLSDVESEDESEDEYVDKRTSKKIKTSAGKLSGSKQDPVQLTLRTENLAPLRRLFDPQILRDELADVKSVSLFCL